MSKGAGTKKNQSPNLSVEALIIFPLGLSWAPSPASAPSTVAMRLDDTATLLKRAAMPQ
jgi:hypothetical protein